jgi:hypothetical protein
VGNSKGPRSVLYDPDGDFPLIGQQASSGSLPFVIAHDQTPIPVTGTLGVTIGSISASFEGDITGSVKLSEAPQVLQGTSPWIVSGSNWIPTVTGSVGISGPVTGTVGLSGPVAVSNFPVTQQITGTVGLAGPVTGSVGITGPVAVTQGTSPWIISGSSWTPVVTGSVRVENVVNVTGSSWTQETFNPSGTYGGRVEGLGPADSTAVGYPVPVAGYESTSGYSRRVAVDSSGRLIIAGQSAIATTAGFVFGRLETTSPATQFVGHTTYNEQSSNAQRSIASTSGSDSLTGAGARVIEIVYYDKDLNGPFTTRVSMNGTTPVNTPVSDICYIERAHVVAAGASGPNQGTITIYASTAGGGGTLGVLAANFGQTLWAHHYIPSGTTCYITGLSAGKAINTSQGSGGTFHIKYKDLSTIASASVNEQISDYHNIFGQDSTSPRLYATPIQASGPGRLQVYCRPDASLTVTYFGSIDFYEEATS